MRGSTRDRAPDHGRRRRPGRYRPRHLRAKATRTADRCGVRRPAVTLLLMAIAIGSLSVTVHQDTGPRASATAAGLTQAVQIPADRRREQVSRSADRAAPQPTPTGPPAGSGAPSPSPSATSRPSQAATASPQPVGGLTQTQMTYAAIIVRVGKQLMLPTRAYIVAIATALQESRLLNLANWAVADSLNLAHDGVGGDHDSVGLFQQRPSSGWGTVAELMDPATAARKFYLALTQVAGWQNLSVATAAQAVQVSAFPDAYAQQEALATLIVSALS
jgi:hypothetical protein